MHPCQAHVLLLFMGQARGVNLASRELTRCLDAVSQNFDRFSARAVLLASLWLCKTRGCGVSPVGRDLPNDWRIPR